MASLAKLLTGLIAVILLTYVAFYGFGHGERTINELTAQSNQALVNYGVIGVTVAFEADPVRSIAHLEGDLPPVRQAQAIAVVRSVPGVSEAVWGRSEEHTSELQ